MAQAKIYWDLENYPQVEKVQFNRMKFWDANFAGTRVKIILLMQVV